MASQDFNAGLTGQLPALRRYALALTRSRDEADDLVQDCVAKAMASAAQWRPGTDLRAWLFRILYTCHVSRIRKQQVRGTPTSVDEVEIGMAADQQARLEAKQIIAALDALPAAQRDAILTVALDDIRYDEAARRLGIPIGTFMSRIARGREALRRIVDGKPNLRVVEGGRG